jgi:5-methylcytosine-specific restriction protein A
MKFEERYGEIWSRIIDLHHTTPVSQLSSDYRINPEKDLVPLCPNCHRVVHRRNPPLTVEELREVLKNR